MSLTVLGMLGPSRVLLPKGQRPVANNMSDMVHCDHAVQEVLQKLLSENIHCQNIDIMFNTKRAAPVSFCVLRTCFKVAPIRPEISSSAMPLLCKTCFLLAYKSTSVLVVNGFEADG